MGTPTLPSEVLICQQALSNMGSTQIISSLQDGSNEANQCALWYPSMRDAMLCEFPWPWAEGYAPLVEIAGPETTQLRANVQWMRSYRYPVATLKLVRVVRTPPPLIPTIPPQTTGNLTLFTGCNETWRRAIGQAYPVSYGLSADVTGKLICSDFYGPYGLTAVVTMALSDPTQWDADFADALVWKLAGKLGMALGYSEKIAKACMEGYASSNKLARATAMNQLQSDTPYIKRQAEVIRRRWSSI
jgi:hypothetical protein